MLTAYLEHAAGSNPQSVFVISAEDKTSYANVAKVVFKFQEMGVERIMCEVPD